MTLKLLDIGLCYTADAYLVSRWAPSGCVPRLRELPITEHLYALPDWEINAKINNSIRRYLS